MFLSPIIALIIILFGGSAWADTAADKVVDIYQAELSKAGTAFDAQVQSATSKAVKSLAAIEAKTKDDGKAEIQALADQVQSGALAPAVADTRRYDVQPAPWRPLTELAADGHMQINAKEGIIEIGANRDPMELGYFKAGTLISFTAIGGMIRMSNGHTVVEVIDPDASGAIEILSGDTATKKWDIRQPLPGGTALKPFVFKVTKDGVYSVRSTPRMAGANTGFGAFVVRLGG